MFNPSKFRALLGKRLMVRETGKPTIPKYTKPQDTRPKYINFAKRPFEIKDLEICVQTVLCGNLYEVSKELDLKLWEVEHILSTKEEAYAVALFKQEFDDSLRDKIQQFAPIAEQFLEDLISGKIEGVSPALRAKYASLALARAGHGEIKNLHIVSGHLTRDDIEKIKERALNAAKEAGVIEGEFKVADEG